LEQFKDVRLEDTYFDRDVEKSFMTISKDTFDKKTKPSLLLANQVGNMYTSSVYSGLVSLLMCNTASELSGKRIGLFSYGSGLASSMFSISVTSDSAPGSNLHKLIGNLSNVKTLLDQRLDIAPEKFTEMMEVREKNCHAAPYEPVGSIDSLYPGTYYLKHVDEAHRRFYGRVSSDEI